MQTPQRAWMKIYLYIQYYKYSKNTDLIPLIKQLALSAVEFRNDPGELLKKCSTSLMAVLQLGIKVWHMLIKIIGNCHSLHAIYRYILVYICISLKCSMLLMLFFQKYSWRQHLVSVLILVSDWKKCSRTSLISTFLHCVRVLRSKQHILLMNCYIMQRAVLNIHGHIHIF